MKKNSSKLFQHLQNCIKQYQLVQPGQQVLVAVSGGVDSMVLLSLMQEVALHWSLRLAAAHFNHHLRDIESTEDEAFVRRYCEGWALPLHSGEAQVATWCTVQRCSVETGARILRYRFLFQLADEHGFDRVATGHTADDQAETVLDHFLRGCGVTGLAGMRRQRERLIRPLLFANRQQILDYAVEKNIPFREDRSNYDLRIHRNRLRHELLPHLQQYNPQIHRTLVRLADKMAEVEEYLSAMAQSALAECLVSEGDDKIILDCQLFLAYFTILKKYLLRLCLKKLGQDERLWDNILYDKVLSLLSRSEQSYYRQLNDQVFFSRSGDRLTIGCSGEAWGEVTMDRLGGSLVRWGDWQLSMVEDRTALATIYQNRDPNQAWVSGDQLNWPLCLRSARPGDRFRPLHLAGSKTLSDFFIDEKIPRHQRRRIPVLWSGDQVVWVCGRRLDDRFKVTAETKTIYALRLTKQREQ